MILPLLLFTIVTFSLSPTPALAASVPEIQQVYASSTPTVVELIQHNATKYDVPYNLILSIAQCESQLSPKAKNKHSTAKGVYQFLSGSWNYYAMKHWGYSPDAFDPSYNIELGAWVIATYGTSPWNSSKSCWSA